jgi:hypothetical protein
VDVGLHPGGVPQGKGPGPARPQPHHPADAVKPGAVVGGEKIYQSDLNELIYSINYNDENLDRFGDKAEVIRKSMVDGLIEEKILEIEEIRRVLRKKEFEFLKALYRINPPMPDILYFDRSIRKIARIPASAKKLASEIRKLIYKYRF